MPAKKIKKMDVMYTLVNMSKHQDDFEFRFSLRSIANQPWLNRVFVLGHCPAWAKDVHHINMTDHHPSRVKDMNIITKVLRACAIREIKDDFYVWSDDIYALKELKPEDFGPWLEHPSQYAPLRNIPEAHIVSTWKKRLVQTVKYCRVKGYPDFTPDFHIPYAVNKYSYPQIMLELPWCTGNGLLTHVFMNILVAKKDLPYPKENPYAIKRIKSPLTLKNIEKELEGVSFLNHNNDGLNYDMQHFLKAKFPEKCQFER